MLGETTMIKWYFSLEKKEIPEEEYKKNFCKVLKRPLR